MKFSEQWLRSWVKPQVSSDELVARLSMVGLEVDATEPVAGQFSGVVVGEVLNVEKHPDAEKLNVCQVSNGAEIFQVVCGAPNVRPGLKIPFAMIGAKLPGDFKIKKAKLRGVESFGMLCSAAELEISSENDGLYELSADAPIGSDIRSYLELDDICIEIGLTPNRGDCLSIAGLAREVGAIYSSRVEPVRIEPASVTHDEVRSVEVLSPEACPRYMGRVIRNVDLSRPTPLWMVERLRRSGIRAIDPAVDITNYVMLELGQPLHAFDLAEIHGGILVRMAEEGERLVLLDGQYIALQANTLIIADHERPLAMAGIMGGEHSGVSERTRSLFLESAFFDTITLAGKARSYGLHTDASHRFERGVDSQLTRQALERATALLLDIVGGEAGPIVEAVSERYLPRTESIVLRAERIEQILGMQMETSKVIGLLSSLGFGVQDDAAGHWRVSVPSYRFDVTLEIDLIEELGRLYGYNRLPIRYPNVRLMPKARSETKVGLSRLKSLLVARGYQEAITYSFIDPKLFALFDPKAQPLLLSNPISQDMAAMRASLWPGLIKALQYNLNRQQVRVRFFESGLRFVGSLGELQQEAVLAGLVSGGCLPEAWSNPNNAVDFYDVKADIEALLATVGNEISYRFVAAEHSALHPGQTARIERDGQLVGYLGALHPELARALDLAQTVYLFELDLAVISSGHLPKFQELSRFPEMKRDLAILVEENLQADVILSMIKESAGEFLVNLKLFDVYQGKGIEPHRKSLAISLTWQHSSRTLSDEEVDAWIKNVLKSLEERFGATLRK
ncbi:phenylalanine--tRNA ligase subunit beta [Azomonas macrocytogenes]|uniref:Phenylalanine--tRNA ligase beta subunit n=1 Tax=Azomonas macrocytogenes TaxID=69962 RepID=A0A839SZ48_AZOMA|nr:phenylalanine--tRNA ligase subunit beta [Azomonas macrocytogenes]MBB3102158.1 phenylalanyl-tRNA synthetase beta chain [Azomonas macrocytogenes]